MVRESDIFHRFRFHRFRITFTILSRITLRARLEELANSRQEIPPPSMLRIPCPTPLEEPIDSDTHFQCMPQHYMYILPKGPNWPINTMIFFFRIIARILLHNQNTTQMRRLHHHVLNESVTATVNPPLKNLMYFNHWI